MKQNAEMVTTTQIGSNLRGRSTEQGRQKRHASRLRDELQSKGTHGAAWLHVRKPASRAIKRGRAGRSSRRRVVLTSPCG